jgi:hypothetical protein
MQWYYNNGNRYFYTATDLTCEKAAEDAAKAASLQAYNAVLAAIIAGSQACEPA